MTKTFKVDSNNWFDIVEKFTQGIAPYSKDKIEYAVFHGNNSGYKFIRVFKTEKAATNYVKKMGACE